MKTRVLTVTAAVLAVLAAGCGSRPPDPFRSIYGTGVGPLVTRPGWEYGYLFGDAYNTSHTDLTIESVSLKGRGVGTVIALAEVRIAPIAAGIHATPGGNYLTDPPVSSLGSQGCHKQALYPVDGYRVKPGGQFRIWIVIKAIRPGRWSIPQQVVAFTESGSIRQHAFPIRYWGTVMTNAHVSPSVPSGDYQASCVKPESAHYLNFYHGPAGR
jgi:hypothetical protein